ncbi:hypothetical protein LRAMOSA10130 [Lichtheimia ramosa]|uniref:Uncharacterized protein n=1 Tax=Lichtheimia ramosa TaxID=688394 RepID=A0A077WNU5_9FUNG|nr:hypothetical protein LRAMOSA10130 [Lichtheimia ramosa]
MAEDTGLADRLVAMRNRLDNYRLRNAAVLEREREQEKLEEAEAETRRQLEEEHARTLKEADQVHPTTVSISPAPAPAPFGTMVTEKDAIDWLKQS